jgi:hypothetical protein
VNNIVPENKQWLSTTDVVKAIAETFFESKGKKFSLVAEQKQNLQKQFVERTVTLTLGEEPVVVGKNLANVLNHLCAVASKHTKKLSTSLLKKDLFLD